MSIDYRERRLHFWCQKVLPLVYDESLSYYELLCKIMKHLSEAETDVSALEEWLRELDEEAVKKIYAEYPFTTERSGNTVVLRDALGVTGKFVTGVSASGGSPMIVTTSHTVDSGSLDPNDENAPEGTTYFSNSVSIDIDEATESKKGAMSAEDKTKVNRLYNTTVSEGDNIIVTATTSANGDKNYQVGVNPNFKVTIQNDYLVGDWEWNANMRGKSDAAYYSSGNTVIANPANLSQQVDMTAIRDRLALQGIYSKAVSPYSSVQNIGASFGAASGYPFALVNCASPVVSGETYYTITTPIDLKVQVTGYNVGNRDYIIYLFTNESDSGTNNPTTNPYLTDEDHYFPSYGVPFIPAKYVAHADANGFFSVTIPAGLTAKAIDTSASAPGNQTGIWNILIIVDGNPVDLKDQVNIDYMKVALKSYLV